MAGYYRGLSKDDVKAMLRDLNESGELEHLLHDVSTSAPTSSMTQGAMTDGAKRRLIDPSEELDKYEVLSLRQEVLKPNVKSAGHSSFSIERAEPETKQGEDIPLPEGIRSLHQWGTTVCELPKFAKRDLTYSSMLVEAKTSKEMANYLGWVLTAGTKSPKLDDLRAFLKASGFDPKSLDGETIKYPCSSFSRRLKD